MISKGADIPVPVSLQPITRDNWRNCIALKVRKNQEGMVASNLYSLAEAFVTPSLRPRGVYHGDSMVGFAMYGRDPDDGEYWIHRLMIDRRYQGHGFGKSALGEVLKDLAQAGDCTQVFISYEPENTRARDLYLKAGFRETGRIIMGETVMHKALAP